jgi:uncharacterized protein (TIGR03067 family)
MRSIATLTLMALMALSAMSRAALADEPKGDLANLQGKWAGKIGPNNEATMTVTIKGKSVELEFSPPRNPNVPEPKLAGEIIVDEKAIPKTFDWVKFLGPAGRELPPILGIYKLEGDTWTTCTSAANKERPAEFKAGENAPPRLTTFARVKEKADEKPIKGDLARFQGTWTASAGDNDEVVITMTVKANTYTAKWDSGDGTKVELKGELRMNDEAKPNKTIDFFNSKRNDGEDVKDALGIYEFDGDKIKLCAGDGGEERPTEFKKGSDGTPHLLTFTRKKD